MIAGLVRVSLRRWRALRRLPRDEAQILALHAAGEDFPSIARQLGISEDEVEHRLVRALIALDRAMEGRVRDP